MQISDSLYIRSDFQFISHRINVSPNLSKILKVLFSANYNNLHWQIFINYSLIVNLSMRKLEMKLEAKKSLFFSGPATKREWEWQSARARCI